MAIFIPGEEMHKGAVCPHFIRVGIQKTGIMNQITHYTFL